MKHLIVLITMLIGLSAMAAEPPKTSNKHRIQVLAGVGPKGTTLNQVGSTVQVKQNKGLVYGIGYSQVVIGSLTAGGQVLSNGTFLGSVGLGF